jgi:NAD(P)-dependent dehydrogenase (short-subunit alcohol dehydrogenase family)
MSDLRVLVTGAGSGIGRATALLYAGRGASLALAGRRKTVLDDVRAECLDAGAADVVVVPTDVTDADACERLVSTAVEAFGGIDVCVHAAAVVAYGRLEEMPLEAIDRVVETNLLGAVRLARPVLRQLRGGGGTLVLLGSLLGHVVVPETGAYCMAKWGLQGLARVLALETRDAPDVHVCVVSPSAVDTPIYREAGNWTGREPRAAWPVADPDDVARAVARIVENPRRELLSGWVTPLVVAASMLAPRLYGVLVGPVMRLIGFTRRPAPPGPGNLWRSGDGQWTP